MKVEGGKQKPKAFLSLSSSSQANAGGLVHVEPVAPFVALVRVPAQRRRRADLKGPSASPELCRGRRGRRAAAAAAAAAAAVVVAAAASSRRRRGPWGSRPGSDADWVRRTGSKGQQGAACMCRRRRRRCCFGGFGKKVGRENGETRKEKKVLRGSKFLTSDVGAVPSTDGWAFFFPSLAPRRLLVIVSQSNTRDTAYSTRRRHRKAC